MNKIELIDARIKEVESTLVYLLHERMALVKAEEASCTHEWRLANGSSADGVCDKCGALEIFS